MGRNQRVSDDTQMENWELRGLRVHVHGKQSFLMTFAAHQKPSFMKTAPFGCAPSAEAVNLSSPFGPHQISVLIPGTFSSLSFDIMLFAGETEKTRVKSCAHHRAVLLTTKNLCLGSLAPLKRL